ncbi:hypothetical protein ACFPK5_06565 [Streptomyces beijiangensis]|uniref:hypothetical protein n=1 Tax=Streptomyces beijiangensis TaxID=163361 RepID=UPI003608EABA
MIRLRTWAGFSPTHSSGPSMLRMVSPKPAPFIIGLCAVMVPGRFWVFRHRRPVFQATAASVSGIR